MRLSRQNHWPVFGWFVLAFTFSTLVLMELSYERGLWMLTSYGAPLTFAFFGASLARGHWKGGMWLGPVFLAWFVLSRVLLGEHYLEESQTNFFLLCTAYLTALPFAGAVDRDGRRKGLLLACALTAFITSVLAWIGVAAALSGECFTLPVLGSSFYLTGGRLWAFDRHPNMAACIWLLGLFAVAYLALTIRKKWFIPLALVLALGLWIGISFTVSRTVMLLCGSAAAIAVFLLLRSRLKPGWLRVTVAVLAALLAAVLVYKGFTWTASAASRLSAGAEAETAQTVAEPTRAPLQIGVRPLENDLKTMTGRTRVFEGFFDLIRHRPKVLALGVLNKNLTIELNRYIPHDTLAVFHHAHNSYIQVTLNLGLPGLALALWFTWLALRSGVRILLLSPGSRTSAAEKLIPIICLTLLISTISEVYLFTDQFPMCNFWFFLCLGYALQIEKRLKAESVAKA